MPASPPHDWPVLEPGWVWLVGAGPGDPGLLTLHALNALMQAEVVLHDALVDARVLAWVRGDARIEPVGKRGGRASAAQESISAALIRHAGAGRRVVRLKAGDPFVFGRGGEEATALAEAGLPFRVVPGITAGIGGLAGAGVPVTHRDHGQAVAFVTGHDRDGALPARIDWAALARAVPVIVLYMAARTLPRIAERLIAAGRAPGEPVVIVMNATLPDERVVETTLARAGEDMARHGLGAPVIICIGRVVELRALLVPVAGLAASCAG